MTNSRIVVFFDLSDTLVDGKTLNNKEYKLMPGARELIEALSNAGAILCIVTSDDVEAAKSAMEKAGLKDRFSVFRANLTLQDTYTDRLNATINEVESKFGRIERSNIFCIDDNGARAKEALSLNLNFICVATGHFSYDQTKLFFDGICPIFKDLTKKNGILAIITGKNQKQQKVEKAKSA